MKAMIIGAGHLGTFLARRLGVATDCWWQGRMEELSVATIRFAAPDYAVNCAGKTDLQWCEDNPGDAFKVNVVETIKLFEKFQSLGIPFIQFSSGCIWDGPYTHDGKPFRPLSPPRPAAWYSWTKAFCDQIILQKDAMTRVATILRPRQVFSSANAKRNMLTKILRYKRLIDTPNSMTSAETIARTIEEIRSEFGPSLPPVLNVYCRGVTSPLKIGEMMAKANMRDLPCRMDKSELDAMPGAKRVDTVLYDPYFERLVNPPRIENELGRCIQELKLRNYDD